MIRTAGRLQLILFCALIALALRPSAFAHDADTSYARVRISGGRIELRLTFDVSTLGKIAPALDADGDLALSKAELFAATKRVEEFLRLHVGIEVNGAAADLGVSHPPFWPLDAPDPLPAALWHSRESLISFPFDIETSMAVKSVALLFDLFGVLSERHTVVGVFEHGGKSQAAIFTARQPDYRFDLPSDASTEAVSRDERRGNASGSPLREFLWQGMLHIWGGYDHLCFLLALLVASRPRQLLGIITSFTIAHSITLTLAALGFVRLNSRLVECAIALSIMVVAVENLLRREPRHRWAISFAFGLIHGFGFANVLGALELPRDSFVRCLLAFNVGVEIGQLAVVLALLPFILLVSRSRCTGRVKAIVSVAIVLLGTAWFADRAFNLNWMPF